ncbi:MAG: ATP-binding protein [Gammaproteobacteria bacterium]|nr:ATP-binding protein [Gammaproteobacteria bacterium]
MLIEFNVTNFRSLRDRQTFSLAKAKGGELSESNTFQVDAVTPFNLLRSAVIYGANAGGKSNLLFALSSMKGVVTESAKNLQRGDKLPVTPFRLSGMTRNAPSEFEVAFIVDKTRYQYGFSTTQERIHDEWLFAYPKGRPQRWFERIWNEELENYNWSFGSSFTGEKHLWQKSTRDNALFLSTAVQLNCEQLQPIFDWFSESLRIASTSIWSPGFSASLCREGKKQEILEFLRAADLGIEDIVIDKKLVDSSMLPDDMPESVVEELTGKEIFDIKTMHKDAEGRDEFFEYDDESDGTQKMFALAGPWVEVLENGCVLFVDELHDNLHLCLVQFLVQLFHSAETNPKNAQLVFTTHETSILTQEIFRRDQVWFCERDKNHATTVYPLTDFSPRKGRENLELAYLSGRYGALPYVRPLRAHG